MSLPRALGGVAALATLVALAGCPGPELTCAEIEPTCTPQYEPTFANIYANTLEPKCVLGGCHTANAARGGLDLSDADTAYAELLEAGEDRVIPGEPSCSELIMRTHTNQREFQMPPGVMLAEAERCALALWVLDGAAGP